MKPGRGKAGNTYNSTMADFDADRAKGYSCRN